jgi:acetyltransferase-like isoleucine patch superfamily enzyme
MSNLLKPFQIFLGIFKHILLKIRLHRYDMDSIAPYFREQGLQVGEGTRIVSKDVGGTFGSEPYLVRLGNNCSIAAGVRFITHDGGVWALRNKHPKLDCFAPIEIRDNVIIGLDSIIMMGVTIGPNCVIGAGSIVTKDIPPNTVAAGVPAKVIMTLAEYEKKKLEQFSPVRGLPHEKRKKILMELWNDWDKKAAEKSVPQ